MIQMRRPKSAVLRVASCVSPPWHSLFDGDLATLLNSAACFVDLGTSSTNLERCCNDLFALGAVGGL